MTAHASFKKSAVIYVIAFLRGKQMFQKYLLKEINEDLILDQIKQMLI